MAKSGKGSGRFVPMTPQAAARIQSRADRCPGSPTAQSNFKVRAQSVAATGPSQQVGPK